ncbi:DUF6207 family protein [Streptomyces sp. c-19]|uniref:DUF6207 family protein n=1 Tax=Streptomyces sp. c-19 TaxID=2789275 RepID=UPI00397FDF17
MDDCCRDSSTTALRSHLRSQIDPIPIHLDEPGLIVLDITATDEATLQAAVEELGRRWATSGTLRVRGGGHRHRLGEHFPYLLFLTRLDGPGEWEPPGTTAEKAPVSPAG